LEAIDVMRAPIWIALLATAVACSPAEDLAERRFDRFESGMVRDKRTGLVWMARDTGPGLSWPDADQHCRALAPGSGDAGWRLPSIEELAALYDTSMQEACGEAAVCRIDPAIHLSSPYLWSATAPQPDRRVYFDFSLGSQLAPLIRPTLTRRVLCTRGARDDGS
jgi:hypothetical protein